MSSATAFDLLSCAGGKKKLLPPLRRGPAGQVGGEGVPERPVTAKPEARCWVDVAASLREASPSQDRPLDKSR